MKLEYVFVLLMIQFSVQESAGWPIMRAIDNRRCHWDFGPARHLLSST
jgi:hypothetical protein